MADPLSITADGVSSLLKSKRKQLRSLFLHYVKGKPEPFRATSEEGDLIDRGALALSLMAICAIATIAMAFLSPIKLSGDLSEIGRFGGWVAMSCAALTLPLYIMLRWWGPGGIFFYVNMGLVGGTLSTLATSFVITLGLLASPIFVEDFGRFQGGKGAGTPIHSIYCGGLEDRGRLLGNAVKLDKNSNGLAHNSARIARNTRQIEENTSAMAVHIQALQQAMQAGQRADETVREGNRTFLRGRQLTLEGLRIRKSGAVLLTESARLREQGSEISERLGTIQSRLLSSYPLLKWLLVISGIAGGFVWFLAGRLVWKASVSPASGIFRRIFVGVAVVVAFVLTVTAFGTFRSGLAEDLMSPAPDLRSAILQLKADFEDNQSRCGSLDNSGLW